MDASVEKILIQCLDALENGRSVDELLAQHAEVAHELRPMLETAVQLSQLNLQPTLSAKAKSQQAFLAHAQTLRHTSIPSVPVLLRWRQQLLPFVSLIIVLLLLGAGLITASASTVPGDLLYGTKRLVEDTRLTLTADPLAKTNLIEAFNRERIQEIETLLQTDREAEVEFEGLIEAMQPEAWIIAGLMVQVDDNTQIEGRPQVGALAQVRGHTRNGRLLAHTINILTSGQPAPAPTAEPTITIEPTVTPTSEPGVLPEPTTTPVVSSTPTVSPTATLIATPESTATPTASPTLAPTFTATIPATATASPTADVPPDTATASPPANDNDNEADDNSNDDDGGNDNENDNSNEDGEDDNHNDNHDDGDGRNESDDNDSSQGND